MDKVGLFIASISHELRNPLGGLSGYQQLLMNTNLSPLQKEYVSRIGSCCYQLVHLINDVLDFSKLSAGTMEINKECFSVKDLEIQSLNVMENKISEKKQVCKFNIESPKFIIADKQKILQVLINLISNASKFSDIGKCIRVNIIKLEEENQIEISVIDEGIGISDIDKEVLFNSFVQLNNNLTKCGTGLGLSISKQIIELMNGEICVKSELGVGSTFIFKFPYIEFDNCNQIINKDIKKLKNKYVLVVDDNEDNRIMLSDILFEWKMNPIICSSALEALRLILNNRYNFSLGLIDICMPHTNGIELAKQIKSEKPLFPLIALSSLPSFIDTSNFEYKIDKPFNKLQLFNYILKVINYEKSSSYLLSSESSESSDSEDSSDSFNLNISNFNKNVNILIAEDFVYNRDMLKHMIQEIGFNNIYTVSNGQEVINIIEQKNIIFDIIILDIKMPVLNGFEVIEYLQNNSINIEIIIISASVITEIKEKCKRIGIKYFIGKPIIYKKLKELLLNISKTIT